MVERDWMATMTQRQFRFGVVAPQAGSAAEWRGIASRAEALGYSSLLLPDTTAPMLAPFAALGVAAASTTTLRVGNWVLANDFRNPVLVAREAATLELLSDGRFELGLGPGRDDNDYGSLGLEPIAGGARLRKLGEALQIIRGLFSGDPVTFKGNYYSVTNARLYPPPRRQLPILIAASGPKAVEQAGRYADIVALGSHSRELLSQQVGWLRAAAGDRFAGIELAGIAFVVPENNPAAVQAAAAIIQRFGLDLERAIASKAPNVVIGSTTAMIEQLQERRSTFGLSYVVVGAQDMDTFAPVVHGLAGT
jgi:probable F420-dependent oxidoreductase